MSQNIVDVIVGRIVTDYVACAIIAVAVYEYLLTIEHEYALWRRKWTVSTWLFLINRYLMILVAVVQFAPYRQHVSVLILLEDRGLQLRQRCDKTLSALLLVQLLPYAVTAVFSALRVHAFCDGNLVLSVLVLFLSIVPIPANAYLTFRLATISEYDTSYGRFCSSSFDISPRTNLYGKHAAAASHRPSSCVFSSSAASVTLGIRLGVIAADVIVLAATWRKTFHIYKLNKTYLSTSKVGLSTIILRDGSLYFLALFVMNVAQILVKASVSSAAVVLRNPVADIIDVMQAILVCRFIVDLRYAASPENTIETIPGAASRFSLPFLRNRSVRNAVGDMGQYFGHPQETDEDSENKVIADD